MTPGSGTDVERVVLRDELRGLGRAFDRTRVDRRDREHGESLGGRIGLTAALLGQLDPGHATGQQRTGVLGDRVPHQHEPRRRFAAFPASVGVFGFGHLPTIPVASAPTITGL